MSLLGELKGDAAEISINVEENFKVLEIEETYAFLRGIYATTYLL